MSDPRITPDPERITRHDSARVIVPVLDLTRSPDGPRDRQLILGDDVTILGESRTHAYVQAAKDGYCGYVAAASLGAPLPATHRVHVPATHAYVHADLKSRDTSSLSFGSQITVLSETNGFAETAFGHVPLQHISPLSQSATDPAAVAALFLGTPYLWGGNSRWGIDCSGLVQAALLACNIPCPGDSDQQQSLGATATGTFQRNDLLFWKGHVALVSDSETLIHANAGSMSTNYESITGAMNRIESAGDGPVTAHRRLHTLS